jgi:hypothetical protein
MEEWNYSAMGFFIEMSGWLHVLIALPQRQVTSDCRIADYYYDSTTLRWALSAFSVSWCFRQFVGLLGRGISPSQGLYLHTDQHKHTINAHTHIHALSGIRTHDPSVQASADTVISGIFLYSGIFIRERLKVDP